jgi:hypothetical protein
MPSAYSPRRPVLVTAVLFVLIRARRARAGGAPAARGVSSRDPLDYEWWLAARSPGIVAYLLPSAAVPLALIAERVLGARRARPAAAPETAVPAVEPAPLPAVPRDPGHARAPLWSGSARG